MSAGVSLKWSITFPMALCNHEFKSEHPHNFSFQTLSPPTKRQIFVWFFYWDDVNLETDGQTRGRGNTHSVNRSSESYQSCPQGSLLHTVRCCQLACPSVHVQSVPGASQNTWTLVSAVAQTGLDQSTKLIPVMRVPVDFQGNITYNI